MKTILNIPLNPYTVNIIIQQNCTDILDKVLFNQVTHPQEGQKVIMCTDDGDTVYIGRVAYVAYHYTNEQLMVRVRVECGKENRL